jgi:hypothetical protein
VARLRVSNDHPLGLLPYVPSVLRVPVLERSAHPEARLREWLRGLTGRTLDVPVNFAGQVDGLL